MAYRSFREVLAGFDTRLDTPPSINRRHLDSSLARSDVMWHPRAFSAMNFERVGLFARHGLD